MDIKKWAIEKLMGTTQTMTQDCEFYEVLKISGKQEKLGGQSKSCNDMFYHQVSPKL